MGSKSRETIYGASVRAAAELAADARKEADRLAVEAWNKRMLGLSTSGSATCDARIPAKAGIADAYVEQALIWSSAPDFER